MECFKCGISDQRALLYDVIVTRGIGQICRKCLAEEPELTQISKPNDAKFRENDKNLTVRERLALSAGINPYEQKKENIKSRELSKQEEKIKLIAEQNFQQEILSNQMSADNFIDHFNWIIMRARRMKKLTQEKLAEELQVSEIAVKMAEQGLVKKGDFNFIKKLENKLGIIILKEDRSITQSNTIQTSFGNENTVSIEVDNSADKIRVGEEGVDFKDLKDEGLTIADLKDAKDTKEQNVLKDIKEDDWYDEVPSTKKIISDEFENL